MTALEILIALLKEFEGCQLTAYRDEVGIWTIGYGETLGITEDMAWTADQATTHLAARAGNFLESVLASCPQLKSEPPYRQAACASLAYNIGSGGFANSTVCHDTIAQLYDQAAEAFLLWDKETIHGQLVVSPGILNRRTKERDIYLNGYHS